MGCLDFALVQRQPAACQSVKQIDSRLDADFTIGHALATTAILATSNKRAPMRTVTSAEAQNRFGELIDSAQRQPVTITRWGRPVAFVLSPEVEHGREGYANSG